MSAKNVMHLTEATFDAEIARADGGPILVDFWATWCGPCRMVAPILDKLSDQYAGKARIAKVDVDANPAVATKFGIMSIPTLLLFKDGKIEEQIVGAQSEQVLSAMLNRHIA